MVKDKIIPVIEKVFDQFDSSEIIRIDQLNLELNDLNLNNLEENIIRQIKSQIPSEIINAIKTKKGTKSKKSIVQTFNFFLNTGTLPWWEEQLNFDDFEQKIEKGLEKEEAEIISLLKQLDKVQLDRLVLQFGDTFLLKLIKLKEEPDSFSAFKKQLLKNFSILFSPRLARNQFWSSTIKLFFKENIAPQDLFEEILIESLEQLSLKVNQPIEITLKKLKETIEQANSKETNLLRAKLNNYILNEQTLKTKVLRVDDLSENKPKVKTSKEFYIQNAGLVILHPFIVFLFQHLEYTKDNKFADKFQQQQAALLLQYLVNNNHKNPEYSLTFNKVLCGIDINHPIESNFILNEEIKIQSHQLLESTINHWSALGKTSPTGLQSAFLQREGKLSKKANGDWKLFIQHKTEDILLTKLPWNISMIKLPWMKNILWVDWA